MVAFLYILLDFVSESVVSLWHKWAVRKSYRKCIFATFTYLRIATVLAHAHNYLSTTFLLFALWYHSRCILTTAIIQMHAHVHVHDQNMSHCFLQHTGRVLGAVLKWMPRKPQDTQSLQVAHSGFFEVYREIFTWGNPEYIHDMY